MSNKFISNRMGINVPKASKNIYMNYSDFKANMKCYTNFRLKLYLLCYQYPK